MAADGGLWALGVLPGRLFGRDCPSGYPKKAVRLGGAPDWREVSGNFYGPLSAVEKNGTLWLQDEGAPEAERPSEYSDWRAVTAADGWVTALAADGTLSVWMPQQRSIFGLPEPKRRPVLSLNIFNTP